MNKSMKTTKMTMLELTDITAIAITLISCGGEKK